MARRISLSFGLQWAIAEGEYIANATNAPTIVNYPGVGAVKSARVTGMTSGQSSGFNLSPGTLDMYGVRWRERTATRPTAANTILRISGAAVYARVKRNSDGSLELSDEDGVIGTTAVLSLNTDYDIGVLFDRTTSAGTHQVRLYINGVEAVGSGIRNISATPNTLEFGANRDGETQTQGDWYFTCIGVNDNTTSDENGVPGAGRYQVYAFPTADGDAAVGASRGGADSGAFWSQLDEVPPNDVTDYVEMNATNSVVWCKVPSAATLGIGGAYIVHLIQVGGRVTLASAGAGNWFPSIKSQSGGAVLDGTATSLASTTWFTHDDTAGAKQYKLTSYRDPQTGGAWLASKIDTMQIGAKTNDGSPATRISALWAIIEYTPFTVHIPHVVEGDFNGGLEVFAGGLS